MKTITDVPVPDWSSMDTNLIEKLDCSPEEISPTDELL